MAESRDHPDDAGGEHLQDAAARPSTPHAGPRHVPDGRPVWPAFVGLAALIAALDQLTKAWIVANVDPLRPVSVVGDLVRLVYSRNTGALFGLFRDNAMLFGLASLVVIGGIVWYHARSGRSPLLSVALGLLLGGALGNLTDRLTRGHVVDFVDAGIGDLRWYTFNVADAAVSLALVLLVALAFAPDRFGGSASAQRTAPPTHDARDD